VDDLTQPVPGPTREQIASVIENAIYRLLDEEGGLDHVAMPVTASAITDAVLALLPARPSPTDLDRSTAAGDNMIWQNLLDRVGAWAETVYPKTPAPWALLGDLVDYARRQRAEIERLGAQRGPVSDDVIRDLVAAAAGLTEGANPTAAGRFADALRRELTARRLEITPAHPTGEPA
jgi:hypothetical protein